MEGGVGDLRAVVLLSQRLLSFGPTLAVFFLSRPLLAFFPPEPLQILSMPDGPARAWRAIRRLGPSRVGGAPEYHDGLGLDAYVQVRCDSGAM